MFSEIKYDGERVQLHKDGDDYKYFSRSLKPVLPHKVSLFKEYIPQAFPEASSLILDAEVLMVSSPYNSSVSSTYLHCRRSAVWLCRHLLCLREYTGPVKESELV